VFTLIGACSGMSFGACSVWVHCCAIIPAFCFFSFSTHDSVGAGVVVDVAGAGAGEGLFVGAGAGGCVALLP